MTFGIIMKNLLNEGDDHKPTLRVFGALSVLMMGVKFFDWLKLFDATSFFIKLLIETFHDIYAFMYLFFATLFMFGCSLYMLSLNQKEDEISIIQPADKFFIFDFMVTQYLLGLGEFNDILDDLENHPQSYFCWLLFFGATFVT